MGKIVKASPNQGDGFCDAGDHKHPLNDLTRWVVPLPKEETDYFFCPADQLLACRDVGSGLFSYYSEKNEDGSVDIDNALARVDDIDGLKGEDRLLIESLIQARAKEASESNTN